MNQKGNSSSHLRFAAYDWSIAAISSTSSVYKLEALNLPAQDSDPLCLTLIRPPKRIQHAGSSTNSAHCSYRLPTPTYPSHTMCLPHHVANPSSISRLLFQPQTASTPCQTQCDIQALHLGHLNPTRVLNQHASSFPRNFHSKQHANI